MNKAKKLCELCNGTEAALYCSSDSALLCWNCDSKVHAANFLVARHLRSILCSNCTHGISPSRFSGYKYHYAHILTPSLCNSCLERDSHSCSSDCISSTDHDQYSSSTTPAANKQNSNSSTSNNNAEVSSKYNINRPSQISQGVEWRNWKAEAVLVNWANKLGISNNRIVVEVGCHVFGMCSIHQSNLKLTAVPYRVGLAAALWLSLRLCEGASSSDNLKHRQLQLKRLEEISGVSTKLIVAAHTKLSRIFKCNKPWLQQQQQQQQEVLEEGWAEC